MPLLKTLVVGVTAFQIQLWSWTHAFSSLHSIPAFVATSKPKAFVPTTTPYNCFSDRSRLSQRVRLSQSNQEDNDAAASDDYINATKYLSDNGNTTNDNDNQTVPNLMDMMVPDRKITRNFLWIYQLGALTGRGEFATAAQKEDAAAVVLALEQENPTPRPTEDRFKMLGRWELVYCSTQLFRSSPFFMAARAVCTTDSQRDQFQWFCDMHRKALAISNIRAVRQVVTSSSHHGKTSSSHLHNSNNNTLSLISEFEVQAGAIPFLSDFTHIRYSGGWPITIDGALVSSAQIRPVLNGTAWEVSMDTVQVKGSNIPGLRQQLDKGWKLSTRPLSDFLARSISSYSTPRPIFRTTYLDDTFRISRDQDDHIFCYVKTSAQDQAVTDYDSIPSDLGIARLLEGFNDAVTKFYL